MARKNKYISSEQVTLELLKADKEGCYRKVIRNINEIIRRNRDIDPEYSKQVEDGVIKYHTHKINEGLKEMGYIDPEEMMRKEEWEGEVGL